MIRNFVLAGVASLLAAPAFAQGRPEYRCPAAGTTVERTRGESVTYRGQGSAPILCATSTGVERVLGYWGAGDAFYRAGRADLERLVDTAFSTGRAGPVTISYFSHSSVGYIPNYVNETWSVPGAERVTTPAGEFDTLRVDRRFQIADTHYRYRQTLWLDRATRAPVKVEVEHLNGIMAAHIFSWQSTNVQNRSVTASR
ncbi:hypothetical protein [Roseococcus sp. YIM B11640]|uniref:hypothetical protein n=1 Tax=Roseococcus sp. YIM B11640 TaxID=3133973 RepID=UPI003C7BC311